MKSVVFAMATGLAIWASVPQAGASNCAVDEYDHNGSLMELQVCDGGNLSISYTRPRSGLQPHGVSDGTLLFDGFEQGGTISGEARLFSGRCGVITYGVSGAKDSSGRIVLQGSAPVRDNNCQVTGHKPDRLVFTLMAAAPPPPTTATPTCPTGFALSGGQCVRTAAATPTPTCPAGFVFSQGQCVSAGGPAPSPTPRTPAPTAGDWYAIAGSFGSRGEAEDRQSALGFGWTVMNTAQCPNFRKGYWIAAAGPFGKQEAQAYSGGASHYGAYVKTCH